MINVRHFHQFLQLFTKPDPDAGVPLADLNAFYNELVRRQRANCQLTPNMFRSIFEMYVVNLTNDYTIEHSTNRVPVIKGLGVPDPSATKFMNLVRYSLLSESNAQAVRTAQGHYNMINQAWNSYVPKHLTNSDSLNQDMSLVSSLRSNLEKSNEQNKALESRISDLESQLKSEN